MGHMGQYHVNVINMLPQRYELIGVYDQNQEKMQEVAQKFETHTFSTMDALLKEADAVVIAVPTVMHYKTAIHTLNAGVHVLLEKPITETVAQAEEIIALAQKKGLILQIGHVERFNGAVQEVMKIINNPLMIECRRMSPYSKRISDVGVVLDLMIHDLDIVLNLVKSPLLKVNAVANNIFTEHAEDVANVQLQFENGCVANFTASRATQSKIRTLSISQEKAYIFLDYAEQDVHIHRQASSAYLMTREEIRYSQESFIEQLYVHKDNPLKLEHMHFYECIIDGSQPLVTGEMDINVLKITHTILEQIQQTNAPRILPMS